MYHPSKTAMGGAARIAVSQRGWLPPRVRRTLLCDSLPAALPPTLAKNARVGHPQWGKVQAKNRGRATRHYIQKMGYGAFWDELSKERIESFLFNVDFYRENLNNILDRTIPRCS